MYKLTGNFPTEERFGVTSQIRRSATSISANIVEGSAKRTRKDFLRYLDIAKGSVAECAFFIELAKDLGYLSTEEYNQLETLRSQTGFLLYRFTSSIRNANP